jgi:hypothetical protein
MHGGEGNLDQQITIDEILAAVNNALNGCMAGNATTGASAQRQASISRPLVLY